MFVGIKILYFVSQQMSSPSISSFLSDDFKERAMASTLSVNVVPDLGREGRYRNRLQFEGVPRVFQKK